MNSGKDIKVWNIDRDEVVQVKADLENRREEFLIVRGSMIRKSDIIGISFRICK